MLLNVDFPRLRYGKHHILPQQTQLTPMNEGNYIIRHTNGLILPFFFLVKGLVKTMTQFKYPITTQRKSPEPMGCMAPPTCIHNNKEQNNNTRGETCKSCSLLSVLWRLLCLSENLHHGRRLLCHLETGWQWQFWWVHESTWWVNALFFFWSFLF